MMSPRVDLDQTGVSNASGGSPMYSSSYPYPGANSKVDKVYPGPSMETMMHNDAADIGTISRTKRARLCCAFHEYNASFKRPKGL